MNVDWLVFPKKKPNWKATDLADRMYWLPSKLNKEAVEQIKK